MPYSHYADHLKPIGCSGCGKISDELKRCTACKSAKYCGKECQLQHWRGGHKRECKVMKRKKERWVEMACLDLEDDEADATGMFICGVRLGVEDEDAPMEPELACKLYEAAATRPILGASGHPVAMLHLALHYEKGIGVKLNYGKAFQYYKSFIEHPFPSEDDLQVAFLRLARFHRDGLGGAERSMTLATKYYCFSKSNAESPEEIQNLEQWWVAKGFGDVTDKLIEDVHRIDPSRFDTELGTTWI